MVFRMNDSHKFPEYEVHEFMSNWNILNQVKYIKWSLLCIKYRDRNIRKQKES